MGTNSSVARKIQEEGVVFVGSMVLSVVEIHPQKSKRSLDFQVQYEERTGVRKRLVFWVLLRRYRDRDSFQTPFLE